ncbi:Com family DNA-binding transcriptional regulator [Acinetobacter higginsii]|uniref:Com family DNA-binding transcriptional regulator n=1 Tax=Acinetobacter higginsii TaxID=70347 RepID=UPI0026772B20|nr:Com family DNA-binding transcriptional regulator [Acinetobacter higginsii]MDO3665044.1 Com family DNA-binding transcriptional regulator [Acinetobacter higginsii]
MQNLKCRCCLKLLAKIGQFDQIEIKCPRCKTLNNFQSTLSALPERAYSIRLNSKTMSSTQVLQQ